MMYEEPEPLVLRQAREVVLEEELRDLPALTREAVKAARQDDDRWATPAKLDTPRFPLELIPGAQRVGEWQERIIAYTRACTLLGRPWPSVLDLLLIANRDTPRLLELFEDYYGYQGLTTWREACQYLRTLRKRLERQSNAV